jgi:tetratricopeptide (TPR) repeat protein
MKFNAFLFLTSYFLLLLTACNSVPPEKIEEAWPRQLLATDVNQVAFVENKTCEGCHEAATKAWRGSHHVQAMQVATKQTVRADFNNTTFNDAQGTTKFYQKDEQFWVNTAGADGKLTDFQVTYTFGITPLQQYLLKFPNGKLQAFTIAWDTIENRWFNLYADQNIAPNHPLHWTKRLFTWNSSCAECHSTDLRLNYDLATHTYKTSWAEINVSCQSCHGAGGNHVKWAANPNDDKSYPNKGLVVDYKKLKSTEVVETCARCHARRYPTSPNESHTSSFYDDYMVELLRPELYHPDGQIKDEVFEYGSFTQSKMYQQGVSCLDCHEPHSLKLRREGNEVCTSCHQANPPTILYKTLVAKNYDGPEHHFHTPTIQGGSSTQGDGTKCINCHMPAKNYMVVDPRRDHKFFVPRPDLSIKLGSPNACIQCHKEQTNEWAVTAMNKWYPPPESGGSQKPHYGEVISAGQRGTVEAMPLLTALANDQTQAAIVRATALELLSGYANVNGADIFPLLEDKSPLVRAMAVHGLAELAPNEKLVVLFPMLRDPQRVVRLEVAKALAVTAVADLPETNRAPFEAAMKEYAASQLSHADQPEGYASLGQFYSLRGDFKLAEQNYQTAIAQDPQYFPAYNNLANLYYQNGNLPQAEQTFRQAIAVAPTEGFLYYSLALLLMEQKKLPDALTNLAKAAELMPDQPRVHYNYGLLLQKAGDMPAAEKALLHAHELSPADPDVMVALISLYKGQQQLDQARLYAQKLTELYPDEPQFRQLSEELSSMK